MTVLARCASLRVAIAGALASGLAGCCTTPPAPPAPAVVSPPVAKTGFIEVGDRLEIWISDISIAGGLPPPINVRVAPDGTISLPFGKLLSAKGKTTTALARDMRDAYVPSVFVNMTATITNWGPESAVRRP